MELILRITGYGDNYQLFNKVKVENRPEYLIMNSGVSKKYFKNTRFHSDNQSDLFLRTKTDSTFRIFVQGASTVVGFPFYHGGSFPRLLKQRLSETFPEKNIEVVNTGITAVNSYTLLDLTDKIIDQKPDLVIIYAGHNEYYGALGVGSASSFGSHPVVVRSFLFLKNFRFFQLLDNTYTKLFSQKKDTPKVTETTLMEVMAKEQRIPLNSEVYHAGTNQFEGNLEKILKTYKKNDIPVIISTIVSNEKDIKPFISDAIEDETKFNKTLQDGNFEANKMAKNNAMAAYTLGRYYLYKNQDTAKKYLHLAKELDFLRFRAPEKMNEVIKNLSKKYNCSLVDMKAIFSSHSSEGIIGSELLTEHLHPNIKGYFIMADAFYNKMKELKYIGNWDNYISYDEAFEYIPITQIDSLRGKFLIDDLKKSWPYDLSMSKNRPLSSYHYIQNPSYEERRAIEIHTNQVIDWRDIMYESYNRYNREKAYKKGLQVAQSLIFEFPEEADVYRLAANMCLKLAKLDKAAYYYFKYNELDKSSLSAQNLASTYIELNKIDLALKTLLDAKNRGFNNEAINGLLNSITIKKN
ncbi:hypothetical protein VP395_15135 [Mariniflexile soesokkakense]|uniref:GDSL-like lipase/acylhydrolase family protein n=1 Tax=Mariniflexile soesokkakense TaxID=1343160 RepID=A0ABV0AFK1_9FLAO